MKRLALFALLAALASPALAQPVPAWKTALDKQLEGYRKARGQEKALCAAPDVGYRPAQYAGKQDCWPGGSILQPNDALLACYVARYGQAPGNPSADDLHRWIPGYTNEMGFVSYAILKNAGAASAAGPDGAALHPGCPSITEVLDVSFQVPKGNAYVFTWYVSLQPGSSAANPQIEHDAARPCGARTMPRALLNYWTQYLVNEPPCGGAPPPPLALCPNGSHDPGETCETCPQDLGACPPAPPVEVACPWLPVPPRILQTARAVPQWGALWGDNKKALVRDLAAWARAYEASRASTGCLAVKVTP